MQQQTAPSRGPAGPFGATWYATLHVLHSVPILVVFVLTVVSGVLSIAWIGMLFLMGLLPTVRWFADAHRQMAARILGHPLPASYRPLPGGAFANLRTRAADPATWRDLAWMLWAVTGGFVLSLTVLVVFLAVVTFPMWFFGTPPVMAMRARIDRALLSPGATEQLEERVHALTESRATVVDHSAAELRRIERDLHDGPQARLAAVALGLGLADDLFDTDPEAARRLVGEARMSSSAALADLRDVVRGIHPPVLADRGLSGAVEALALDLPVAVDIRIDIPGRLPEPIESAVYFTVAECFANAVKHAGPEQVWVRLRHDGGVLVGEVGDDGRGGADPRGGTGLQGIASRLAAFDGTMTLSSPTGGPTLVRWEVPCASSSRKTMRS